MQAKPRVSADADLDSLTGDPSPNLRSSKSFLATVADLSLYLTNFANFNGKDSPPI